MQTTKVLDNICLNPCFNGRYSRRLKEILLEEDARNVLILVLMEDTLGEHFRSTIFKVKISLNPCFNGR
ncbi:hypothetical protein, partial [Prevotella sp. F0091]|uniref:hypothetical protein n=1 Tax=Prevotella sp. F0091 TaxID=1227276 RepID=UPI001E5CF7DD